jgi:hypothetical protein
MVAKVFAKELLMDGLGFLLAVVGGIGVLGAILSRLQGFPVTPENKDDFLWIDRWQGKLALGLWPLWTLMLLVGVVLLLLGY